MNCVFQKCMYKVINLYEWPLSKPEGNLNRLSATISDFIYHPGGTKIKQKFFKKHTFSFKNVSVSDAALVIENVPINKASGGNAA